MRRLFWLGMGITIGALVVRKLSRAAEKLTPQGMAGALAESLRDLAEAIGDFGADVRAAAAAREEELRAGTGLDAPLPEPDRAPLQLPGGRRGGAHVADR
jgi:chromosome condensin MukBEF MukE localization factor